MAINVKKEPPTAIDNELFQFYTRYQMCQIKKSTSLWNNSKEKEAMLTILTEFENVDGNTLRLIVNQIFENSIQKFNNSDKESEGMNVDTTVIHSAPTNETGATKMEALESKQDNCEDELEEASTSDSHAKNMISVVPLVENEAPIIVPKNIQEILSLPSIEEIQHMTTHIERSKYILLKRMRVVDESFKFKASAQNASYTVRVYNLLGNSRSPLYQSQLNLIAYRFGKVVQHETLYSSQNVKEVERKLYGDLIREMKKFGRKWIAPYARFIRYSEKVVKTVEKIGVYACFIPEVLSPYVLQTISRERLPIVQKYIDMRFSQFKSLAKYETDGKMILTNLKTLGKNVSKRNEDYKESRFLNSCN